MPRLSVLAAPFLLVSLAPAAPVPREAKEPSLYYPTVVGTKWAVDYCSISPRRVTTYIVVDVKVEEGGAKLVSVAEEGDREKEIVEKVRVAREGIFLVERGHARFDPPVCMLKLPVKAGGEWESRNTFCNVKWRYKHTTAEPEWVTVPAGRFRAIRVVEDKQNAAGGAEMWPTTHWYVAGVGCVKSTTPGGWLVLMKSFTPEK